LYRRDNPLPQTRSDVLADAIRGALDDCRIRLGPRTERAFVERVGELLDAAGYRLIRQPPGTTIVVRRDADSSRHDESCRCSRCNLARVESIVDRLPDPDA
jgi:hypothetical protein